VSFDDDRNQTPAADPDATPLLDTGWAIITDNAVAIADSVPTYTVTERRWDPDALTGNGGMKTCTHWPDQVAQTAYDAQGSIAHQIGQEVLFWRHRGDDGKMKNIICAPGTTIYFGVATSDWTDHEAFGPLVVVNPAINALGGVPNPAVEHTVFFLDDGMLHPNVREDDVIGYFAVSSGGWVSYLACWGERYQERIGSVKMWHDAASIPAGWALADGQAHSGVTTRDLRGRFIAGYNSADADYSTVGNTGGSKTHTHDNHANHNHTLAAGSGVGTGGDFSCSTGNESAALTHSTDDSRPPYYVMVWIERVN